MNILISGHQEFIGSNLVKKLSDHNIIGIDIKNGHNILDLQDLESIFKQNNIDIIIHLAAIPGVEYSVEHSQEILYNNIIGFDNLVKLAIKYNVKHFIYASSSSVYGDKGQLKSPYAISKATNELQAQVYSNNMKFTGLRFFTVYGENIREDLAICKFIDAIKNNKLIHIYGDGTQSRDFTYVGDICDAIKVIVESDKDWKNEIFDVGYGKSITINELLSILRDILENKVFDKVVYENERDYDVKDTLADPNKLYEWFGFKPKYDIKKGLEKWLQHLVY